MGDSLNASERDLRRLQSALRLSTPLKTVQQARRRGEERREQLARAQRVRLQQLRERLLHTSRALQAASPQHILARGYALVRDEAGAVIRAAAQVSKNQRLNVQLARTRSV